MALQVAWLKKVEALASRLCFQDKVSDVPSPVRIFGEDAGEPGPSQISNGDGAEEHLPVWQGLGREIL